ncbi:cysteine-rich receptor-like protein kinase 8 [Tanacetum coccineum]
MDHPRLLLISKKLNGSDNYSSWKRSMMIALNAKNKMKIINGEFPKPSSDSANRALWERNNDMIISWILNTIAEHIGNNLNFINSASKLSLELQELYAQIDGHRIDQLSNDIVQLKQVDCTIEVYYHKIKGLWDEFDALEAPYVCTCVCSYENGERDQRKRLIQFLMGLDDSYDNIRGQILLMQPLPSVVKAYNMIKSTYSQGESSERRNYNQGETFERRSSFRKGVICGNYGNEGHIKEQCYKIMRYPIGHPLHGKYQPPKAQKQEFKPNRTINMATTQEDTSTQAKSPQTAQLNTLSDAHFSARIDMLQNQLNQSQTLKALGS